MSSPDATENDGPSDSDDDGVVARRLANLSLDSDITGIQFVNYVDESQLHYVMKLVGDDLSEPYSIFTYRYFLYRFPHLCILAVPDGDDTPIGCVVAKIDEEEEEAPGPPPPSAGPPAPLPRPPAVLTGYIGMLAVREGYRRRGIGQALVRLVIQRLRALGCRSVTLETEVTNRRAMRLYQDRFGFIREELLGRYYLNWNDAYRLRLWFDDAEEQATAAAQRGG